VIDRVVSKINNECVYLDSPSLLTVPDLLLSALARRAKISRKRLNEEEADITYIKEQSHNRVFNKKVGFFRQSAIEVTYHCCHTDCAVLRQIYIRDSGQLRARHSAVTPFSLVLDGSLIVSYTELFIVMLDQARMLSELVAVFHPSKSVSNMH
jgi:hypothetical protein